MDVLLHDAMQFHIGLSPRCLGGDVFETLVSDRITLPVVGTAVLICNYLILQHL